jgi:Protein of unknown function (DUF3788)
VPAHRVPVLTDPDVVPDEVQIRAALGEAFVFWKGLESALTDPPFRLDLSWHYFRDGGWLRKALRGTRNLAWLAVWEDYATVTFYFAARHREGLVALPVPDALRDQAAEAEMTGRLLPLVIEIRSEADVAAALEVLRYKLGPSRPGGSSPRTEH